MVHSFLVAYINMRFHFIQVTETVQHLMQIFEANTDEYPGSYHNIVYPPCIFGQCPFYQFAKRFSPGRWVGHPLNEFNWVFNSPLVLVYSVIFHDCKY